MDDLYFRPSILPISAKIRMFAANFKEKLADKWISFQ